jgi:undecaprenyl diphosphate synthase
MKFKKKFKNIRIDMILILLILVFLFPSLWLIKYFNVFFNKKKQNDYEKIVYNVNNLGVIMDGNRRYALFNGKNIEHSYKLGVEKFFQVAKLCLEENIRFLTVYALSLDNLKKRTEDEIRAIFKVSYEGIENRERWLVKEGIKVEFIGSLKTLPKDIFDRISRLSEKTANGKNLTIFILMAYDPIEDILFGIKNILNEKENILIQKNNIDEFKLLSSLRSNKIPPIDLIIRTGGGERLSGFLPIQSIYSEMIFLAAMWPEVSINMVRKIIRSFANKKRNFGA